LASVLLTSPSEAFGLEKCATRIARPRDFCGSSRVAARSSPFWVKLNAYIPSVAGRWSFPRPPRTFRSPGGPSRDVRRLVSEPQVTCCRQPPPCRDASPASQCLHRSSGSGPPGLRSSQDTIFSNPGRRFDLPLLGFAQTSASCPFGPPAHLRPCPSIDFRSGIHSRVHIAVCASVTRYHPRESCSDLTVSHRLAGLRCLALRRPGCRTSRCALCGLVASRCRSWGSARFRLLPGGRLLPRQPSFKGCRCRSLRRGHPRAVRTPRRIPLTAGRTLSPGPRSSTMFASSFLTFLPTSPLPAPYFGRLSRSAHPRGVSPTASPYHRTPFAGDRWPILPGFMSPPRPFDPVHLFQSDRTINHRTPCDD